MHALVERHALRHLPDGSGDLGEAVALVEQFLATPRAGELAAAKEVHRELEFLLSCETKGVGSLFPGPLPGTCDYRGAEKTPDPFYLHGFIDCLYRDAAGRWRLLDYKTNRVAEEQMTEVASRYEMQMLVYGMAVEQITGQPPEELSLCFLRLGREHRFAWDDRARKRVAELVAERLKEIRKGG
jgi:ATP-dependent helicase/nuclease subunit A